MSEELNNASAGQEMSDGNADYIATIKAMKENTVSKERYLKLQEDNKRLLNAYANGQQLENDIKVEKPDINKLREELYGKDCHLNNLEYIKKTLELRNAIMEEPDGKDPFVPWGKKVSPTANDFDVANNVASVLQECVDYADGNNSIFTDELQRRIYK